MRTEAPLEDFVSFRPMVVDDEGFIFNSWLKSFRNSAQTCNVVGPVYYAEHNRLVARLLKRSTVIVAINPDEPSQILGYVVAENMSGVLVLHYVYVKAPFRNMGIARALVRLACSEARGGVHHTHATEAGARLIKRLGSVFNPYLTH